MSSKLRCLIYARCSTTQHNQKPEVQIDELRRYCGARGWEIVEEIVDHGYSGATDKRPGLRRLHELTRARKVDAVVVVKLDRLFRSLRHIVTALEEFQELGVQFVSIGDQIDLSSAGGKLMVHLLGAFAEFERSLIRDRTLLGLAHAVANGKRLGRPPTHFTKDILDLRNAGQSYRSICKQLGCSMGVVGRAIQGAPKTKTEDAKKSGVETNGKS
jgi:DNA invertase Pin-like site-specific DNA recombinase